MGSPSALFDWRHIGVGVIVSMADMTSMRRLGFSLASWLALAACDSNSIGMPSAQGIYGLVTFGPMCPVQTTVDPCPDIPYQAVIEVSSPSGPPLTSVISGKDGKFMLGLPPGTYRLRPMPWVTRLVPPFPAAEEQTIEVERGSFTSVLITFDSGIR